MIKKYNAIYNTKTCRLVINNIANTATSKAKKQRMHKKIDSDMITRDCEK